MTAAVQPAPETGVVLQPELAAALVEFQGCVPPIKKTRTANMGTYSYKYADISDIREAIREPLKSSGLAVTQSLNGGGESGYMTITTKVWHKSGQAQSSTIEFAIGKRTPQEVGSHLTYYKRYALSSELGLSTEEDDDGAAASRPERANGKPADEVRDEAAQDEAVAAADGARREILRGLEPLGWTDKKLIKRFADDYNGEDLLKILDPDRIRAFGRTLWDEAQQQKRAEAPAEQAPDMDEAQQAEPAKPPTLEHLISKPQLTRLHTMLSKAKMDTHEARIAWCSDVLGHPLESTAEIRRDEVGRLFDELEPPK